VKSLTKIITVTFLSLLLFFNCTETPPELIEDRWVLLDLLNPAGEKQAEELVFFLHGKDEEGVDDIQSMMVEHLDSQIQWIMEGEFLQRYQQGGENWFGSYHLLMPGGRDFPHGEYKASLTDKAGSSSEYFWTLVEDQAPDELPHSPDLNIKDKELIILDEDERPWRILFYQKDSLVFQDYIRSQVRWRIPSNIVEMDWDIYLLYIDPYTLRGWKIGPFTRD